MAKCILCESTKECYKSHITCGKIKDLWVQAKRFIDRTGQIFGNIAIIKELNNSAMIGKCLLCKSEKEYSKGILVLGGLNS